MFITRLSLPWILESFNCSGLLFFLVRFILKYSVLLLCFEAIMRGIVSLISFSVCLSVLFLKDTHLYVNFVPRHFAETVHHQP